MAENLKASQPLMNASGKFVPWVKRYLRHTAPYVVARSAIEALMAHLQQKGSLDARVVSFNPPNHSLGNVLFSHVIEPFVLEADHPSLHSHTHFWEARQAVETFVDLGYSVDVMSFRNHTFIPQKPYAFFVDTRFNFERMVPLLNKECRNILHAETSHVLFHNVAESQRLWDLYQRKGVALRPRRWERPNAALDAADYITLYGNAFTLATYRHLAKPIYLLPVSTTVLFPYPEGKDFASCHKHYMWFGSGGMVHKGLDLALEAFAGMPDYHLTICGPVQREKDFERAYYQELYETPNIHTVGWIDTRSERFREITTSCVGLIFPSCSEGQASSVVECLHAGLIPIISRESGVDVQDFGVMLQTSSIEEIKQTIATVSNLPIAELRSRARQAWEFARGNHTRERFAEVYRKVIQDIVATAQ
jgi:glycosyltransferase involved in cell wall biosynthesis